MLYIKTFLEYVYLSQFPNFHNNGLHRGSNLLEFNPYNMPLHVTKHKNLP